MVKVVLELRIVQTVVVEEKNLDSLLPEFKRAGLSVVRIEKENPERLKNGENRERFNLPERNEA